MALTLRTTKGDLLTHQELDGNFTHLEGKINTEESARIDADTALQTAIDNGVTKRMAMFITEGIVSHRGIYLDGVKIGSVTSSINSPNVAMEQRLFIGSKRKNVNEENGSAAIGLGWFYQSPFELDTAGKEITVANDSPVRVKVEFYRENEAGEKTGTPVLGYITAEGISVATAPKPLKNIESL